MRDQIKPTKDEVIDLERSFWDAIQQKDGRRARELVGETSLVVGSNGVMSVSKDKMSEMALAGDWTLESYRFEDVEVTVPAVDVAIIAYTVAEKVTIKAKSQHLRAADSSTWVRGGNGWECHAHSETLLSEKEAG